MSTSEHSFEPMTTGMVLDKTFRLYLQNFPLMIALSAILNIPLLVFTFFMGASRINVTNVNVFAVLIGMLAFLIAMIIITPLITGATTRAVSDIYLGNPVTASSAISMAWSKAWTLLKTQLVVSLIVALGFMLLFVPGVLWFLSYALVAPVVMIEGSSVGREIRHRSWGLVKGYRGKVFVIFLVVVVIQLLVQAGAAFMAVMSFGVGNLPTFSRISDGIISILLYPVSAIAVTLLYYDLRIRKEGFDLEMLSRAIGNPSPEA